MITYSFENSIFQVQLKGDIRFKDIINYLKDFGELEHLPQDILLLYDLDRIETDFSLSEIRMISHLAELSTKKYNSVKTAIVVNDPKLTAFSSLFSESVKGKKTIRKIFSGKNTAIKWLHYNPF